VNIGILINVIWWWQRDCWLNE